MPGDGQAVRAVEGVDRAAELLGAVGGGEFGDLGGYGSDGDGDASQNVYDPGDALRAWFLQAHDAPGELQAALFAYGHSAAYASDVLSSAARTPRRHPGDPGRPQLAVSAGCRRAAARWNRRQGPRLRRGPARPALPVGRHRPGRLRLLQAGHDGLPRRRSVVTTAIRSRQGPG
jgi:hypothetical protein